MIDYTPLWVELTRRRMTRKELQEKAGISCRAITRMGRNENVNASTLDKICRALNCSLSEIGEIKPGEITPRGVHSGD